VIALAIASAEATPTRDGGAERQAEVVRGDDVRRVVDGNEHRAVGEEPDRDGAVAASERLGEETRGANVDGLPAEVDERELVLLVHEVESREMKVVLQRVSRASVVVRGSLRGEIGPGLLVLLGIADGDREDDAARLAGKVARLRVFEDETGRFDRSLLDTGGAALVVSQFTLLADTVKGNRPSFTAAAPAERAEPLYESFSAALRELGVAVEAGVFGARMEVELVNDGPVTIVLDTT